MKSGNDYMTNMYYNMQIQKDLKVVRFQVIKHYKLPSQQTL